MEEDKNVVAIVPNKQALTVEVYYEDGTTGKFKFNTDMGMSWEEMLEPLECLIVSKH